ncbi:hypothetical protein HHI36_019520, partial [Cryptolaemus montrouzieri]
EHNNEIFSHNNNQNFDNNFKTHVEQGHEEIITSNFTEQYDVSEIEEIEYMEALVEKCFSADFNNIPRKIFLQLATRIHDKDESVSKKQNTSRRMETEPL